MSYVSSNDSQYFDQTQTSYRVIKRGIAEKNRPKQHLSFDLRTSDLTDVTDRLMDPNRDHLMDPLWDRPMDPFRDQWDEHPHP